MPSRTIQGLSGMDEPSRLRNPVGQIERSGIQMTAQEADLTRRHRRAVAGICLGTFAVWVTSSSLNLDLPHIHRSLGGTSSSLEWVVNSYTLSFAVFLLTAGTVGDRIGHRRAFIIGLVIFGGASPLCAFANSLSFLIGARFVQGVGASMLVANSMALLSDTFLDSRARSRAAGIWGGVSAAGVATGPLVGGLLVDATGWRSVFWLNVPVVVGSSLLTMRSVERSPLSAARSLDLGGQILGILALSSLTLGLIQGPSWGWESTRFVACMAVAVLAAGLFFFTESRQREPMLPLGLFKRRLMVSATAIGSLFFFCGFGSTFVISLWLQDIRGDSAFTSGLLFLPYSVTGLFLSVVAGRLAGRYGPRLPVSIGTVFLAAGAAVLATCGMRSSALLLELGLILLGIGGSLSTPPLIGVMLNAAESNESGIASGSFNTSRQVGGLLGVILLGTIFTSNHERLGEVYGIMAGLYVLAGILSVRWIRAPTPSTAPAPREESARR